MPRPSACNNKRVRGGFMITSATSAFALKESSSIGTGSVSAMPIGVALMASS